MFLAIYEKVKEAIKGRDVVYHLAAMKHICTGESQPMETVETNIIGTNNIVKACEMYSKKLIYLSTDKSVYPINTYGCTKLIAEKIIMNSTIDSVIVRSGNVIGSRGSIIPYFKELKKKNFSVPLTDINMERYFIQIHKLVKILIEALRYYFVVIIPRMEKYKIIDIINKLGCKYHIIGRQPGEKLKEDLMWDGEFTNSKILDGFYMIEY
jgi:UDP-N-acetylglucosamine 4,6-dehydratase